MIASALIFLLSVLFGAYSWVLYQQLEKDFGERLFTERLAKLPEAIRTDVSTALATAPAKRTQLQEHD